MQQPLGHLPSDLHLPLLSCLHSTSSPGECSYQNRLDIVLVNLLGRRSITYIVGSTKDHITAALSNVSGESA